MLCTTPPDEGATFFMNEGKTISLCITNYNRMEWVLRAFEQVLYDDRIWEIIIRDDTSDLPVYSELESATAGMDKVRLIRNQQNIGCYLNKMATIHSANEDFCIILDSDNFISTSFLDKIYEQQWDEHIILAPDMGEPALNYKALSGKVLTRENISGLVDTSNTAMALNTMNYFMNRKQYLSVFDDSVEPWTSDSIFFNYCWLAAGNSIKIVDGLEYHHEIHKDSHYTLHNQKNPGFYNDVFMKLRYLK
jgi:glycosyltransferase involved in cell wall biosynthesis